MMPPRNSAVVPSSTPWLVAASAALALIVIRSLGAPLGEPVADDFYFLRRSLLEHGGNLLDGGGFPMYWRPLSRQIYFSLLGPLMLKWPAAIAALHLALLALASWLLFRTLTRAMPAHWASFAATFPLLIESVRMLIAWPSHFQDLGLILFGALALHEAASRRLWTCLLSLLAALLCKEPAVLLAMLVPWTPRESPTPRRERITWVCATSALVAFWGASYWAIRRHLGQLMPWDFGTALELRSTSFVQRYLWALARSSEDASGVSGLPSTWGTIVSVALLLLFAISALMLMRRDARARLQRTWPWAAFGLVWFVLASFTLVNTFPLWAPYRSVFGAMGLGIACAALLGSVHRSLLWAIFVVRLTAFTASPGAPSTISLAPEEHGSALDFPKLARAQRFIRDTRTALLARYPTLLRSSRVVPYYLPRMAEYAYAGNRALQVWYRDTTLTIVPMEHFREGSTEGVAAIVEYERDSRPQVAFVEPTAMRSLFDAIHFMERADWAGALPYLHRADSLQVGNEARAFGATVAGRRAACLLGLGDVTGAEAEAQRGLAMWRNNADSRRVLAVIFAMRGQLAAAEAQLDTQVARYPQDEQARMLRSRIHSMRGTSRGP